MKDKILVYGKSGGYAVVATFLGNQWWITSKDDKLEPLFDNSPYAESDYRYLCEVGELIQMRDLAGMMGSALEMPEENIKVVLTNRLKDLNMMGVKFVASVQYLNLDVRVFSNKGTKREGNYSVICSDLDAQRTLFDIDSFDDAKEALSWFNVYKEFFLKHGVKVCSTLHCTEDVLELLNGMTSGMKIEISNL
jgi:hypothetical protein